MQLKRTLALAAALGVFVAVASGVIVFGDTAGNVFCLEPAKK